MKPIHPAFFLGLIILLLGSGPTSAFTRAPVTAENGMAVTSQHIASDVGIDILRQGGNAVLRRHRCPREGGSGAAAQQQNDQSKEECRVDRFHGLGLRAGSRAKHGLP